MYNINAEAYYDSGDTTSMQGEGGVLKRREGTTTTVLNTILSVQQKWYNDYNHNENINDDKISTQST